MIEKENGMLEDAMLEGVVGGVGAERSARFSGKVAPEACVVGQSYYVVQGTTWYHAELKEISFRNAERYLKFQTTSHNGYDASISLNLNASQIAIYTTRLAAF